MRVLSIETSCDETSLALFDVEINTKEPTFTILSHLIHSQIEIHREYGGVFPKLAKREHAKNIVPLFVETLKKTNLLFKKEGDLDSKENTYTYEEIEKFFEKEEDLREHIYEFLNSYTLPHIDLITVTNGPGLEPALWVGINFAKIMGTLLHIPVIPVNHMEGHIVSIFSTNENTFTVPNITFPILSLLVSGGHTELVLINNWGSYIILGQTKDDAVGEAFDKVARLLGFPYPGGPEISKKADYARTNNLPSVVTLPRPMMYSKDYNFSFSGIKTAVLYATQNKNFTDDQKASISKEFEDAVSEVLVYKTFKAIEEYGVSSLIVAGGVSANNYLKFLLHKKNKELGLDIELYFPEKNMTGDNALMIGIAGVMNYLRKKNPPALDTIKAEGNIIL